MNRYLKEQVFPIVLTVFTFLALSVIFYFLIQLLNLLPSKEKIVPEVRVQDVLIGLTIYLKTSVDFAIFIGNLMHSNPGWKKRISIETGTAAGNAAGTFVILVIWNFFREVPVLMVIMIIIASLVLLKMAQESLEEFLVHKENYQRLHMPVSFLEKQLEFLNRFTKPFLGLALPDISITSIKVMGFVGLAIFSFSVPFILGLDDFAGYIPLFSIVNVYGFAVGVFLGHMLLNISLFLSPEVTVKIVRAPLILVLGGLAFVGIALWGFWEVLQIIQQTH